VYDLCSHILARSSRSSDIWHYTVYNVCISTPLLPIFVFLALYFGPMTGT